jgi:hypothetical protein
MAELQKAVGVNVELVEQLVKAHFGPEFTSKLTWSLTKGRYLPSDLPRRIAAPQKLLGIRVWWKTIGEFSDNLGFRLELWDPAHLPQAQALVAAYNARTQATQMELHPFFMHWPVAGRAAA